MKHKKVYLYMETDLPEEGWFQGCLICYTITARTKLFKIIQTPVRATEVHAFLCSPCQRMIVTTPKKEADFCQQCEEAMKAYYL